MMAAVTEDTITMPIMSSEEENLTLVVNEFTVPDQDDQKQQPQQQPPPSSSDSDSNTIPVENGNANTTCCTMMDDSNVDEDLSKKKKNNNNNNNNNINENDHENDDNSSAETDDNDNDDNDNDDDQDSSSSSYWDILISLYLPILFLWFRRSMFGSANLIRSIVVGQLMRLVFVDDILNRISEKLHLPPWLQVILFTTTTNTQSSSSATTNDSSVLGCAVAGSSRIEKIDPYAWPPPAFTALALLTIFALVVHPDGGTWIMLGKLRDAILTVLSTLAQSWEFLVNDYGVFPTIAAATTLATLLFLVFIVLRTLSPKHRHRSGTNNNNHNNSHVHHNEKKRRKKKGSNNRHKRDHNHNHHNHRSNRIKKNNSDLPTHQETPPLPGSSSSSSSSSSSPISISPRPSNIHDTINSHHASASSLPPSCPSLILDTADATGTTNSSLNEPILESGSSITPTSTNVVNHGGTSSTVGSSRTSNISIGTQADYTVATNDTTINTTNAGKDNTSRRRMMSGSTLDTTAMSDDQSCGSASVRSYPSVSVNSNRSSGGSNINININGSGSGNGVDTKIMNKKGTTGTGTNNSRRAAKRSTRSNAGKKNKAATPTVETSVSSRWDALKPDHNDCNMNYISSSSPHRANGKLNNSNIKNQHQQRYQRGNNRRVGHHVGNETSSRKGRQLAVNEPPMIDRNLSNNKAASMQKSSPARRWSNEISLPIASLTPTTSTPTAAAAATTISSPGLNPFASSSSNIKPLPPPGFQETANVGLLHNNNEDILMTAPPKLFDTSPHVINDWRTAEDCSTAAAASMMMTSSPQRVVLSPEFFQSSSPTGTIQENPFCNNNSNTVSTPTYRRDNSQIEAELQELGGQMAGSILDF